MSSTNIRRGRALLALALSALTAGPASATGPLTVVRAEANPAIVVNVDAAAGQHPIDPRIYGSAWASPAEIAALGLTLNRWGGNAMSRYNWAFSTANRCKDYYFENVPDDVSAGDGSNGKSADDFIDATRASGAQPVLTIPVLSLLPKDRSYRCGYSIAKYGPQDDADYQWRPDCGNGKLNGNRLLHVNDPADTAATYPASHQGNWVQHLINTYGTAAAGGVRYYSLDNEPSLWSFDHWDIHPDGATYDEVWGKMQEYGALIKAKDAGAITTGPEEWGWSGYFASGKDQENYGTASQGADAAAHGGEAYIDWLLDQAHAYQVAHGTRILDVLTVHYYPQSGEFADAGNVTPEMQQLRNRSTRSLWDPNYVDESWIGGTEIGGARVQLIPRLKQWVANHYPGTEIGITEYNWGAEDHINGATTQADILGIFGREGLNLGVRWTTPAVGSFAAKAFQMYRNYDGAHAKFGDTSVSATAPNPDEVSAFAARRSGDNALTVMLIAKTLTGDTPATVNLAGFTAGGNAQRWQLTSAGTIAHLADVTVSGSSAALTLPAQSITLLVIPAAAAPSAPVLTATAGSTSSVTLTWTAVPGATAYEIQRSANNSPFAPLTATGAVTATTDTALTSNTTYLYKIRAVVSGTPGPFSAIDPATTILFTDDPLTPGTRAKTVHLTELRTAVNAIRAAAGLTAQVFTDPSPSPGLRIKAIHLTELRTALTQARTTLGLPALTYTDPTLTAGVTKLKAVHLTEVRNGVK